MWNYFIDLLLLAVTVIIIYANRREFKRTNNRMNELLFNIFYKDYVEQPCYFNKRFEEYLDTMVKREYISLNDSLMLMDKYIKRLSLKQEEPFNNN